MKHAVETSFRYEPSESEQYFNSVMAINTARNNERACSG
jgi:hypothetical protein